MTRKTGFVKVQLQALPGAKKEDAIREAIATAFMNNCTVEVQYSAFLYTVDFEEIIQGIYNTERRHQSSEAFDNGTHTEAY